jgi:hypothetical protein
VSIRGFSIPLSDLGLTLPLRERLPPTRIFPPLPPAYGRALALRLPRPHRVAQKFGGRYRAGAVFESRKLVGHTWDGRPDAPIAHRILWLEGLEPGLNRGGKVDTHARYIYIHGVGDESRLGRPASHGCIHLSAADLLPFYRLVPKGTLVWITRR